MICGIVAGSPIVVPANDPSYASVGLLLHLDGTNGSTTITDHSPSPKTVTATNCTISTAQQKFGTGSVSLNGTNGSLSAPDDAAWDFGSGDFTVEAWIRPDSVPPTGQYRGIVVQRDSGTSNFAWALYVNGDNSGAVRFDYSTTGTTTSGSALAGIPAATTWSHVAAVRSGTSLTVYLNGVGGTSHNIAALVIANSPTSLRVGVLSAGTSSGFFGGHIDDLRITKGIARYTANFTPPTLPFPNS